MQEPVSLARQRFTVMGTLLGRLGLQLVKGEGSPVLTGVQGAVLAWAAHAREEFIKKEHDSQAPRLQQAKDGLDRHPYLVPLGKNHFHAVILGLASGRFTSSIPLFNSADT